MAVPVSRGDEDGTRHDPHVTESSRRELLSKRLRQVLWSLCVLSRGRGLVQLHAGLSESGLRQARDQNRRSKQTGHHWRGPSVKLPLPVNVERRSSFTALEANVKYGRAGLSAH